MSITEIGEAIAAIDTNINESADLEDLKRTLDSNMSMIKTALDGIHDILAGNTEA